MAYGDLSILGSVFCFLFFFFFLLFFFFFRLSFFKKLMFWAHFFLEMHKMCIFRAMKIWFLDFVTNSLFLLHFWRDRNLCLMALKIFYDNFDGCTLKLSPWMSFHVPGPWNMVSTINWIMAQMHPFQFIALFTFFSTLEIFFTLQNHFLLKEKKSQLGLL